MSNQKPSARASAPMRSTIATPAFGADRDPPPFKTPYPDKQMEGPFPYAYAIIEGPPGKWSPVCLEGVTAREVVRLEPNGQAEPPARAMMRIQSAISQRTIAKKWGKP